MRSDLNYSSGTFLLLKRFWKRGKWPTLYLCNMSSAILLPSAIYILALSNLVLNLKQK